MATDCVQVQTTAGSREEADRLASVLLERRLAACVQLLGPVESRYWWEGRVESASEWLCLAKTTAARVDEVVAAIGDAHSYDTPEVLVTAVRDGNERYLRWVEETVILGP
ncbi:MAG TPA: divalent-cation tolerance protein CutA [Acidimicrobiales bacterium]|nr:divalent-cation tolerance protein CutA [Acidimicrobiales bacterium]